MNILASRIEKLKNNQNVQEKINTRMKEFEKNNTCKNERWFSELSFCVLTANSSAKMGIKIQNELKSDGFIQLPLEDLKNELKDLGHRFYRTRAEYIAENRKYSHNIKDNITQFSESKDARKWLVENIKGIGYKEGSHFLRNVGYKDLMILDRHVLRILEEFEVIEKIPKTLTKKRYLNIEEKVEDLAQKIELSLAKIDLYIWYMDTGKILK